MKKNTSRLVVAMVLLALAAAGVWSVTDIIALSGEASDNGMPINNGNLRVYVYDSPTGGSLVYDSGTDYNGVVDSGRYDIDIGDGSNTLALEYGKLYYMDISIDGQDLDFSGTERRMFQSSIGTVASAKLGTGSVTSGKIADASILDADIAGSAEINKSKISWIGTWDQAEIPALTSGWPGTVDSSRIANSGALNVNSSTWWSGVSSFLSGWLINQGTFLAFNETKLSALLGTYNETARVNGLNQTKGAVGRCASGLFMQNISSTGIGCADPGSSSFGGEDVNMTFHDIDLTGSIRLYDYPIADGTPEFWNPIFQEFLSANAYQFQPMLGTAISSGVIAAGTGDATHPGVIQLRDSTTANGGYRIMTDATAFRIAGTERARFIFQDVETAATGQYRMGFQDSTSVTAPVDGCYINVANNILSGICRSNNVQTATGTTYTLSDSTWYDARLEINSGATLVNFSLYSSAGSLLWTNTVSSNIPNSAGRETGFGILATESSTDAASGIMNIDFLNLKIKRNLGR